MRRLQIHVAARVIFANHWNTINISLKASRDAALHSKGVPNRLRLLQVVLWLLDNFPPPPSAGPVIFHSDENIDFDSLSRPPPSAISIRGRRDVDVCLSV